ncbi:MAG: CDP-6-deoxy-delta-3,4-glucoseen reductase [Burkholderiales bacterium]
MSITVTLQPSGRSFSVQRDEAILAAAIRQGIGLPYGCRDGACGSCKCKLLEGRVIHGAHQVHALSVAEEEAGYALTCCAAPQTDVVLEARTVVGAGDMLVRKMPARVISIDKPAPNVAIVKLQLPASEALRYHAGQYVDVILRDGMRRSYSMANAPHTQSDKPWVELHIRHMLGGVFSEQVFGTLKAKDILRLEGPFGSFFIREESHKPIVLLASGTGFAPIKALIEQLRFKGSERSATLYWGCRTRTDLYMHEAVLEIAAQTPTLHYVPVLSEALASDAWAGRTGFVHQAVMADIPDLSSHQVYACGAPVMVESALRDFTERCGLPADEFYADAFYSAADRVTVITA